MPFPAYALTVELHLPLTASLQELRNALAAEGMELICEWTVPDDRLNAAPGPANPPQMLLGIGAPALAHALLSVEPDIGALLPCSGYARETAPGHTRLALQDPMIIAAQTRNTAVRTACKTAQTSLRRVVDRLMLGPPARLYSQSRN